MPEPREALTVVREVYDAAREHGPQQLIERYGDWFSGDFEWRPILLGSLDGRSYQGEVEFREYWDDFLEAWTDIELGEGAVEAIDDERVLVTARLRAAGSGSGVPIDRTVAYLFEVRDGLIVTGRTFFSPTDAREFLASA